MDIDVSDIPKTVLRSIASAYRMKVYDLRCRAYQLWKDRGTELWIQKKKEAIRSDNRVEYWKWQIELALASNSHERR